MNKKFDKIHKLTDNPFLNLYQMDALDTKGMPFSYYFASRNDAQHIKIRTKSVRAEGIVIYAVTEEAQPRLVLIRQYRYPFFMGPGFTDETSATVFGTVSGTVSDAFAEDTEEIQVILADKEKVRHILANERVSIRGAYLMMHFLHASEPFSFLDA